jgi:ABC-type proline/glycine betaine transport system permease subunit
VNPVGTVEVVAVAVGCAVAVGVGVAFACGRPLSASTPMTPNTIASSTIPAMTAMSVLLRRFSGGGGAIMPGYGGWNPLGAP